MWKYYNPHPQGALVGDCFIRAVAKAEGITWKEALDLLNEIRKDEPLSLTIHDDNNFHAFIERKGYHYIEVGEPTESLFSDDYFITIDELSKRTGETPIIISARIEHKIYDDHVVCAVNGNYYDVWDSGGAYVSGYYCKKLPPGYAEKWGKFYKKAYPDEGGLYDYYRQ